MCDTQCARKVLEEAAFNNMADPVAFRKVRCQIGHMYASHLAGDCFASGLRTCQGFAMAG